MATVDTARAPWAGLTRRGHVIAAVAFAVAFFLTAELGEQFELPSGYSPWYPPAGIMLAYLLVAGPALAPVAFLVRMGTIAAVSWPTFEADPVATGLRALAIVGTYSIAALVLRRGLLATARVRDFGWFVVVGVVGAPIVASILIALVDTAREGIDAAEAYEAARTFWVGDAVAIATIVPVVLLVSYNVRNGWPHPPLPHGAVNRMEAIAQAAAIIVVPVIVFAAREGEEAVPFLFIAVLPLIWVALRRDLVAAAAGVLIVNTAIAIGARVRFGAGVELLDVQIVMLAAAVGSLFAGSLYHTQVQSLRDALDLQEARNEMRRAARHDDLTGLLNRAGIIAMASAGEPAALDGAGLLVPRSVLAVQLDRFDLLIDGLGSDAADRATVEVGVRLTSAAEPVDLVARLGPGEFAVLHEGDVASAEALASRVADAVRGELAVERPGVALTASIGVSALVDPTLPERGLHEAALAARQAQAAGGDRTVVFDDTHRVAAEAHLATIADLRRALHVGEMTLHYQPIVRLGTGQITALEALVRWQHPERGLVAPMEFIAIAESTGLMVPLGGAVLDLVAAQLRGWGSSPGVVPVDLHVNLSVRQLEDEGLVEQVLARFDGDGLRRIWFEVTETAVMHRPDVVLATLQALRSEGARVVLDDFGTGQSAIAWLHRFPVDQLKIDRSFVTGLAADPGRRRIVETIVGLAGSLGLEVTAEGIETAEDCGALRDMGCEQGQGYYFARPLHVDQVTALLDGTSALPRVLDQPA